MRVLILIHTAFVTLFGNELAIVFEILFVGVTVFLIFRKHSSSKKICTQCGCIGKEVGRSSFLGELGVWGIFILLSFLFPLLILVPILYTLYRFFGGGKKGKCSNCKSPTMVPIDSPVGIQLYKKYYDTENEQK